MITITHYMIVILTAILAYGHKLESILESYLADMRKHELQLRANKLEFNSLSIEFEPMFDDPSYGKIGRVFFANGYGISVGTGKGHYCDPFVTFEIAVIHGNNDKFDLIYDTPITNDVIGHLSWESVESTARLIAALPLRHI